MTSQVLSCVMISVLFASMLAANYEEYDNGKYGIFMYKGHPEDPCTYYVVEVPEKMRLQVMGGEWQGDNGNFPDENFRIVIDTKIQMQGIKSKGVSVVTGRILNTRVLTFPYNKVIVGGLLGTLKVENPNIMDKLALIQYRYEKDKKRDSEEDGSSDSENSDIAPKHNDYKGKYFVYQATDDIFVIEVPENMRVQVNLGKWQGKKANVPDEDFKIEIDDKISLQGHKSIGVLVLTKDTVNARVITVPYNTIAADGSLQILGSPLANDWRAFLKYRQWKESCQQPASSNTANFSIPSIPSAGVKNRSRDVDDESSRKKQRQDDGPLFKGASVNEKNGVTFVQIPDDAPIHVNNQLIYTPEAWQQKTPKQKQQQTFGGFTNGAGVVVRGDIGRGIFITITPSSLRTRSVIVDPINWIYEKPTSQLRQLKPTEVGYRQQ